MRCVGTVVRGIRTPIIKENDDFTKNLVTMIGEKRLIPYIKAQYKTAFVKDTIANIITGITLA